MGVDELLDHAMRDGIAGFDTGNCRVFTHEEMMAQYIAQLECEKSMPRIVIMDNLGDEALSILGLKLRSDFEVMIGVDCSEPVMIRPVDTPKFARSKDYSEKDYSESRKNKSDRKRDRANRWR